MSAPHLRVVTSEEARAVAADRVVREALKLAQKFIDYDRLGHQKMTVRAGDPLVEAVKELLP